MREVLRLAEEPGVIRRERIDQHLHLAPAPVAFDLLQVVGERVEPAVAKALLQARDDHRLFDVRLERDAAVRVDQARDLLHVAARDARPGERRRGRQSHDETTDGTKLPTSLSDPQTRSTLRRILTEPFTFARPSTYADAVRSPKTGASSSSSGATLITSDTESTMMPISIVALLSAMSTTMMHVRSV